MKKLISCLLVASMLCSGTCVYGAETGGSQEGDALWETAGVEDDVALAGDDEDTGLTEAVIDSVDGEDVVDAEELEAVEAEYEEYISSEENASDAGEEILLTDEEQDLVDLETASADEPATGDQPATDDDPEVQLSSTDNFSIKVSIDGYKVKSWRSKKTGKYYLFLPNNVKLSAFTFKCSGIQVKKVSQGSYDKTTGVISSAFSSNYDEITITSSNSKKYKVAAVVSDKPSVMITLNGTTLSTIHKGSKEIKYGGNTVRIVDGDKNTEIMEDVELKGRGNTTWNVGEKKPYQIKFDSKTSVLGMGKAKKWVLLANAFDDSLMRNMLAFDTASKLGMNWSVTYKPVNLWISGVYRGTYLIGEKVEIGETRLNLTHQQGILVEQDTAYYQQEDYWFTTSLYPFAVKETVSEDEADIKAAMKNFKTKFEGLLTYLNNTSPDEVTIKELSKYIDVESFAQYYLMTEFFRSVDSYLTSAYFYMDGPDDVIHYSPVWDYDASMGNLRDSGYASATQYADNISMYIPVLMCSHAFNKYVKTYYSKHKSVFRKTADQVTTYYNQLKKAAKMNYTRWEYALGRKKGDTNYKVKEDVADFQTTYAKAAVTLKNWLTNRYSFFSPGSEEVALTQRSGTMIVNFRTSISASYFMAAIWSETGGQDDLQWIRLNKGSNGLFYAIYPTTNLKHTGKIHVSVYNGSTIVGGAKTRISRLMRKSVVKAKDTSKKETTFRITAQNAYPLSSISVAVWSKTGGQDDLKWYSMKSANGYRYADIPISDHKTAGTYYAHVYIDNKFAGSTTFKVSKVPVKGVTVTGVDNQNGTGTMTVKGVSAVAGIAKVEMKTYAKSNGSSVTHTVTMKKNKMALTAAPSTSKITNLNMVLM